MTYADMRECLRKLGVWAPPKPTGWRPRLRCGSGRGGTPIAGVYLNESKGGRAFITLNTNFPANRTFCDALNPYLWPDVAEDDLPDAIRVEHKRHVYPEGSGECEALIEFVGSLCPEGSAR